MGSRIIEIQIQDNLSKEWSTIELSKIRNECNQLVVAGKFRILVNGTPVYVKAKGK